MARLDNVIDRMLREGGHELVLATGCGIVVRDAAGERAVVKQKLTSQQIIGALSEIAPSDVQRDFPQPGTTHFPYGAPAGAVSVRVEWCDGSIQASLAPYGQGASAPPAAVAPPPAAVAPPPAAVAPPRTPTPVPAAVPAGSAVAARRVTRELPVVAAPAGEDAQQMARLLTLMLEKGASDLHLTSGQPPALRIDGSMAVLEGWEALAPARLQAMLWSLTPARNRAHWEETHDTDFAHETEAARFRVNVFEDRRGIGAVMRQIPNKIRSAEEMGLSKHILDLCSLHKGLVLVTGPTGSGKSTTLAGMIDYINRERDDHIITIEDPIEFVHPNKRCLVHQREVGAHTQSFKSALRAALREDPDVVLVGELRDLETIAIAIETAETGHLVFGTLHTNTAPSTVDRIIDQFPTDRQSQVRTMLSESLKAVIAQTLCKRIGGGRAAALEVLLVTNSVSNLIREGKTFQIPSVMQTGRAQGMVTLNDSLLELVKRGVVEPREAYSKAVARAELKATLERAGYSLEAGGKAE